MTWSFGDGFDLYAAVADGYQGYWDSGSVGANITLTTGRFTGSQTLSLNNATAGWIKSSGVNDAVHHLVLSYRQTAAISGTTLGAYLQLSDGATAQCSVVFRSDGAILLTSGGPAGTALATYTGAFPVTNTWYAFEIEVSINNATGVFNVRKNGNNVNDFSATALNTRGGTANNYANKLQLGMNAGVNAQQVDDFFWQSGAATGGWLGDIRCYTRMPAADQSALFSKSPTSVTQSINSGTSISVTAGQARYSPFTAAYDGAVGAGVLTMAGGFTGNTKCSIFSSIAGAPGLVLGSATTIVNPVTGSNALVFGTPVTVTKGTQYWVGFCSDTTSGSYGSGNSASGFQSSTAYASFPAASPSVGVSNGPAGTVTITIGTNNCLVNEPQQDGLTSYVYDSNPGDADFYGVASIPSTPAVVIATTVRAYMQKSDAGTRTAAVQLKSGATTVASPTLTLTTSGFLWAWRTDVVDPATGAGWTATGVNNAQIGPTVIA